jgi:hypothetical protein
MLKTAGLVIGKTFLKLVMAMISEKVIIDTFLAFAEDYVSKTKNTTDDVFIGRLKEVLKG